MEKRFDPVLHEYYYGNTEINGVTKVLKLSGFTNPFCESDVGSKFGKDLHEVIKLKFHNRLISVDEKFNPWMIGIEKFFKEQEPIPYVSADRGVERIIISTQIKLAGTIDFFGKIKRFEKKVCILDWKSWTVVNNQEFALAGLQMEGYEILIREIETINPNLKIPHAVVHFFPGNYRIYPWYEPSDRSIFMGALFGAKWKQKYLP
jgi:hypothetical protein